jgi:O-methyltransferase
MVLIMMRLTPLEARYIDLLKKCLSFSLWDCKDGSIDMDEFCEQSRWRRGLKSFRRGLLHILQGDDFYKRIRNRGVDWPVFAHTMVGVQRLDNLQACIESVFYNNIPGDLVETGVWRGGCCILMRALVKVYCENRTVYACDSFEGLPKPTASADNGDKHHTFKPVAVSLETVQDNFRKYDLLDGKVKFIKGWFSVTLPGLKHTLDKIAVLRLDGDMYASTWDGLINLYAKVSPGGYVIIDDYYAVEGCQKAVDHFRRIFGITNPIQQIDGSGVYWQV